MLDCFPSHCRAAIEEFITANKVVAFIKGTKQFPQVRRAAVQHSGEMMVARHGSPTGALLSMTLSSRAANMRCEAMSGLHRPVQSA